VAAYRKKPVVVEATQWFKNGDHPEWMHGGQDPFLSEGRVVRQQCGHCGISMHDHGWIDTLEGGHIIVCPGDWIITGVNGEHYPCKPDIFTATYELATPPLKLPRVVNCRERRPRAPDEG
jgi:hypothetical protein